MTKYERALLKGIAWMLVVMAEILWFYLMHKQKGRRKKV